MPSHFTGGDLHQMQWPEWITASLDADVTNSTVRGAFSDWLDEEHPSEAILSSCLRYMCFAPKWPSLRQLSPSVDNLAMGFGWFSSGGGPSSIPPELMPPKFSAIYRARRYWAWSTRQDAELWFVSLWEIAPEETREKLLRKATNNG